MARRVSAAPNFRQLFQLAQADKEEDRSLPTTSIIADGCSMISTLAGSREAVMSGEGSRRGNKSTQSSGSGPLEQMWFGLWLIVGVAFLWLVFVVQQVSAFPC
jgi:hypothetical protein